MKQSGNWVEDCNLWGRWDDWGRGLHVDLAMCDGNDDVEDDEMMMMIAVFLLCVLLCVLLAAEAVSGLT